MFRKKTERNQGPSFQRNDEHSTLPENSKREIEGTRRHEERVMSSVLASDAEIEGTIKFDGTMRIDGKINGEISTDKGKLVVSESGIVNAVIMTENAVIEGRVDGEIVASDKVVLKQKAHLIGDLQAKILVIEEGVVIAGRCNVNPKGVKSDNSVNKDQLKKDRNQQNNFSINKSNTVKSAR